MRAMPKSRIRTDAVLPDQDVLRLQVAMDDALAVGGLQAARHLPRHIQRVGHGERAAGVEALPGGAPRHVVGDDEQLTVDLLEGVHRGDVRMRQGRGGARLEPETFAPRLVGRVMRVQDLQRDEPGEPRVFSQVDDAHPATPQRAHDAIGADHRARRHHRRGVVEQERRHARPGIGEKPVGAGVRAEQRIHLGPQLAVVAARLVEERDSFAPLALPRLVEQRRDTRPAIRAVSHLRAMLTTPKQIRCPPAPGTATPAPASSRA